MSYILETPPEEFAQALLSLRQVTPSKDIQITEVPAPGTLAPFSAAFTARLLPTEHNTTDVQTRVVILYDPAGQQGWNGNFRLVMLLRADVDEEMGSDSLLGEVTWSWFNEAMREHGTGFHHLSGTVTRVLSQTFGGLELRGERNQVELRASWSPTTADLTPHVDSVLYLMKVMAGQRMTSTNSNY